MARDESTRTVGLLGATGVGIGAIVGGGIMVLAGVAFENAGPAAVVAFAANGVIAFLTAMSFAEISSRFPQSGGAYTFATKVLSVRAAFGVGWILWFAYIVAGVLYALGFAAFAVEGVGRLWKEAGGTPPDWLSTRRTLLVVATLATAAYALSLIRKNTGGGQLATVGKVVVFVVLILVGLVAVVRQPAQESIDALSPFFSGGAKGLLVAMGLTFIALQGFDLVAAIAGEVKDPGRNIPRAMFLSLGCALVIYVPLILLLTVVGVEDGETITQLAEQRGDTVFAVAVSRYMGEAGYWLVIVAAVLSTLSALHANVLAASRVALSMSLDRTLPSVLSQLHKTRKTPVIAVYATALAMVAIIFMIPDVGTAGAAAGLIFLVSFALAHGTAYLARMRSERQADGYRTPLFPLVPVVGGGACIAMAVFQAVAVPDATRIVLVWLGIGALLYVWLLRETAETADASAEAFDPSLVALRGKRPLVLLPIANPAHARALIGVANAIAPTQYARVLLLSVVPVDGRDKEGGVSLSTLDSAQEVVKHALSASYATGEAPEALITTAADPWEEIYRVATEHDCQGLLIGLHSKEKGSELLGGKIEVLLNRVDCDVSVMSAPEGWSLGEAKRILVPVGGLGEEHGLRARVLGSLCRIQDREVTFLSVVPEGTSDQAVRDRKRAISSLAGLKVQRAPSVEVVRSNDPAGAIVEASRGHDLILVGLKSLGWRRKVVGPISMRIARDAACATIMLSAARSSALAELYKPLRLAASVIPGKPRG